MPPKRTVPRPEPIDVLQGIARAVTARRELVAEELARIGPNRCWSRHDNARHNSLRWAEQDAADGWLPYDPQLIAGRDLTETENKY
jgi:hypothetical protein